MCETHHSTCPSCGEAVTTLGTGLCPRCLSGNASEDVTSSYVTDGQEGAVTEAMPSLEETRELLPPPGDDGSPHDRHSSVGHAARLELFGEIGRGGMGIVLRGRDHDLGRDLAVKVLRADLHANPEMAVRFIEEAHITGQLQHPGVVPIHQLGTCDDGRPYFTMKLVKGRTLSQLLSDGSQSEPDRARFLGIFEQVCQTVAYAHAHGVIHRDLKPSNVMVGSFGEVQVMDWGLAKVLSHGGSTARVETPVAAETPVEETVITTARSLADSDLSRPGSVLGTVSYMAPEQARGETGRVDERADVFALGAILCRLLTGKPPFVGETGAEILRVAAAGNLADATDRLDHCGTDAELVALARACLMPERDERPRDASVVATRLAAYLAGVQKRLHDAELATVEAEAKAEAESRRWRAERQRRRATLVTAVAVLALAGLGGLWATRVMLDRQAARAQFDDLIARASSALDRAEKGEGSAAEAAWLEARQAVARAEDVADGRPTGAAAASLRVLSDRMALDDRLHVLVAQLEEARAHYNSSFEEGKVAEAEFTSAFRDLGLDPDVAPPSKFAAIFAGRSIAPEVAAAMDNWVSLRRHPGIVSDLSSWPRILKAARAVDPDPFRDSVRAIRARIVDGAYTGLADLQKLVNDPAALERQPAASLDLLAALLKRQGDPRLARSILELGWRRYPGDFSINVSLAQFCAAENQRAMEQAYLMAAIATRPRNVYLHAYLASCLLDQGKLGEAIAESRELTRLGSEMASSHSALVRLLRERNLLDAAESHATQARQSTPKDPRLFYEYGLTLEAQGKRELAIEAFRKADAIDAGNSVVGYAAHRLVDKLRLVGRTDEAISLLHQAVDRYTKPGAPEYPKEIVDMMVRLGRPKEAAELLAPFCERNPADDLLGFELAILYLAAGDDAAYRRQCLAMLERFGTMSSVSGAVRASTSCLLSLRPVEIEKASRVAQLACEAPASAQPGTNEHTWRYVGLALADHRNGHFAHAAELLESLHVPGSIMLRVESLLALTYARLGRKDDACRRLERCWDVLAAGRGIFDLSEWHDHVVCELFCREAEAVIFENDAPGRGAGPHSSRGVDYARVEILRRSRRLDEAIALLRPTVLLKADDNRARRTLGEFLAERGRWDEALKELDEAAKREPSDDGFLLQVATLHLYRGDDAGYRRQSRALLDRFAKSGGAPAARAAKSCLLSPRPVELERASGLAQRGFEAARSSNPQAEHYGWTQLDWALAEHRRRHFDQAADLLKKCANEGSVFGVQCRALLALNYAERGLKVEARWLLASCRTALRKSAEAPLGWGYEWHDYLTCEFFCREAEVLVRDDATSPSPPKTASDRDTNASEEGSAP